MALIRSRTRSKDKSGNAQHLRSAYPVTRQNGSQRARVRTSVSTFRGPALGPNWSAGTVSTRQRLRSITSGAASPETVRLPLSRLGGSICLIRTTHRAMQILNRYLTYLSALAPTTGWRTYVFCGVSAHMPVSRPHYERCGRSKGIAKPLSAVPHGCLHSGLIYNRHCKA